MKAEVEETEEVPVEVVIIEVSRMDLSELLAAQEHDRIDGCYPDDWHGRRMSVREEFGI